MFFVLATRNLKKVTELKSVLQAIGHNLISLSEFEKDYHLKIPKVKEIGDTFYKNALLKAESISRYSRLPVIADDSGLVVPLLNGSPGVHSARYAEEIVGKKVRDKDNVSKLLQELHKYSDFKESTPAYFITVIIALIMSDRKNISPPKIVVGEGKCEGMVINKCRGKNGFGYDPIFIPNKNNPKKLTFSEMEIEAKNAISHRSQAAKKLIDNLTKNCF